MDLSTKHYDSINRLLTGRNSLIGRRSGLDDIGINCREGVRDTVCPSVVAHNGT